MKLKERILDFNRQHKTVFIPYITAGVPSAKDTVELILNLDHLGCAAIELGVPFSDPVADGTVNMQVMELSLANGTTLKGCLEMVRAVRQRGCEIPIIIFSYLNPILAMGYESFAKMAVESGVNAVLCVDLPLEHADEVWKIFEKAGLEMVFLAAPTTQGKRLELLKKYSPAFIYYVSRLGVTGTQKELSETLHTEVDNLRKATENQFPICVGFGISTADHVRTVSTYADGVIAGSVLMKQFIDHPSSAGCRAVEETVKILLSK